MSTVGPSTRIIATGVALPASAEKIEASSIANNYALKAAIKPAATVVRLATVSETCAKLTAENTIPFPLATLTSNNKFQHQKNQSAQAITVNRSLSKNVLPSTTSLSNGNGLNQNSGQNVTARLMDMGKRLLDAAREGQTDNVRQLVVNSGAPFTSDWLGTTALHLAAQNGHYEIAEILLRGGVNRDARTKLERTALHLAAQGGWLEVVDLLLMHGSEVNARDMLRMTPLHWSVERGHVRVVERLLFNGADSTVKNKFQLTPIDIAQSSESYAMIELLKSWTNKSENFRIFSDFASSFCESHDNILLDTMDYHLAHHHSAIKSTISSGSNLNNDTIKPTCQTNNNINSNTNNNTKLQQELNLQRATILDISEPCIDLVELEWNALRLKPDFFLSNDDETNLEDDDDVDDDDEDDNNEDENEPKVEYLMKVVEELQKENRQLRQRVEQLSTTIP